MLKNKPFLEEDIDLIGLLLMLWRGKWKLILIIFIVTLFGSISLYIKDSTRVEIKPFYETEIILSVEITAPFPLDDNKIYSLFKSLFNSENIFKDWKDENFSEIMLTDFSDTKLFEKSLIKKDDKELFKSFKIKDDGTHYIFFRIPNFSYIDDIYNYSKYISDLLNAKVTNLFKKEIENINHKFSEYNSYYPNKPDAKYLYDQILIEQYLFDLNSGFNVIDIERPTKPIENLTQKELSSKNILIFVFFGFIIGVIAIFLLNAISIRKKFN